MNRTLNVVRMQLVNKWTFIWVPLIILVATFLMTLVIFSMIPGNSNKAGGGIQAPMWYLMAMGIQAMSLTFPFSQAMSVTRREFYTGTMLLGVLTSASLSLIIGILGFIEQATNGWGVNGIFFRVVLPLWEQSPLLAVLTFFSGGLFLFVMGFLFATIYRRWGAVMVVIFGILLGAVLLGFVILVTKFELWDNVGTFFLNLGSWGTLGLGLVIVALVAVASYAPLRRSVA